MGFLLLNFLLAALPSFALIVYFYHRDRNKPEPMGLVFRTFLYGIAIIFPAVILEFVLESTMITNIPILQNLFRAFIIAAFVEEGLKYFVVKHFLFERPEFDELTDGIIYTITASLGFAFFENLFYSFGGPTTLLVRGITAVPLHASASGIMGYYIGMGKFENALALHRGLLIAVLIHGAYDFFLFQGGYFSFLVIPLLLFAFRRLLVLYRRAAEEDSRYGRL